MSAATMTEPTLRRSPSGAMAGGGTLAYEVYLGDRWIGWVGDEREWRGHRYGPRRWWCCWREADDTAARWNSSDYRTRDEAVAVLVAVANS